VTETDVRLVVLVHERTDYVPSGTQKAFGLEFDTFELMLTAIFTAVHERHGKDTRVINNQIFDSAVKVRNRGVSIRVVIEKLRIIGCNSLRFEILISNETRRIINVRFQRDRATESLASQKFDSPNFIWCNNDAISGG